MLRPVIAPVVGILAASAALGLTCNALRDHDSIEIGRAYFAPSATVAPPGDRGAEDPVGTDTTDAWAAADLATRAAREFTLVDADRALDLLAVAESIPGRVLFIDSREDSLFANGHIPDALQIDYFNLHRNVEPSLPFLRLIPWLVVYCESDDCDDGFLLCQVLRDEYGIPPERLLLYLGGMREWRKLGHPIARGVGLR